MSRHELAIALQVTHIFATRVSTDTLAGVTGMLLSQDNPGGDAGKSGGGSVHASVYGRCTWWVFMGHLYG